MTFCKQKGPLENPIVTQKTANKKRNIVCYENKALYFYTIFQNKNCGNFIFIPTFV